MNKLSLFVLSFFVIFFSLLITPQAHAQTDDTSASSSTAPCIWQICSVDTMKMSRDDARQYGNDPSFDATISAQMQLIKGTGANYVAIDTPYDSEFIPYLTRWVTIARQNGLKVWFRGNWSGWEGWFDYPKTVTPSQHIQMTYDFIRSNPSLFADGDIFDACPECDMAGYWPEKASDGAYTDFIKQETASNAAAFKSIGKNVTTNITSVIGGHAKTIMDQSTVDALKGVVSIDHYVPDVATMSAYINYFNTTFQAKTMVAEFGAPIPDINGDMTEGQQASFVDSILNDLYVQKNMVVGLNYYVLNNGSTALINNDGSKREVYTVLRAYFSPGTIVGEVTDNLGNPLANIPIIVSGTTTSTVTDSDGNYQLIVPAKSTSLLINDQPYKGASATVIFPEDKRRVVRNFILTPISSSSADMLTSLTKQLNFPQ
jgi:carboxypeptidase family protein